MNSRRERFAASAVAAAVFAAFLPVLRNGFIADWDDDANFLLNPYFRGFGRPQLRWMLTAVFSGHYHPLTWLSLALDYTVWGMNPAGYHLTSLLLHCANAALFFLIAWRLFKAARPESNDAGLLRASAAAALLFGLHPLRVESVAWASERRDVLCACFYLATVLFWLRREREKAVACYAASLLSKAMGVTLPFALLILERWPLRRKPDWRDKAPFFAMAAAALAAGFAAEIPNGAARSLSAYPLWARLGVAAYGLVFYARKTLWPSALLPIYAMPPDYSWRAGSFAASGALVTAAAAALWAARRRRPELFWGTAFYALTLVPVLNLSLFGPQLVADRYSYLSCLPWALLAATPLLAPKRGRLAAAAGICLALGVLTWRRALAWQDSDTLFTAAAKADPGCWVARLYLGNHRLAAGDAAGAQALYREAIRINPIYAAAYNNLGNALLAAGRPEEAVESLRRAAQLKPDHVGVHANLAQALLKAGRKKEAAAEFRRERGP